MTQPIVSRRSEVMGGAAVFHGTRVPVETLMDYLEAGETIDDFLEGFPSVTRRQVVAFLEEAKTRMIEAASRGSFSTNVSIVDWHVTSSVTMSRPPSDWIGIHH